jgi:hypothetical protein
MENLQLLWKKDVGAGTHGRAQPTVVNNVIYQGFLDGRFLAMDGDTGQTLWAFQTGGPITGAAAVSEGRVCFGSWDGRVYCRDAATGDKVWTYDTRDGTDPLTFPDATKDATPDNADENETIAFTISFATIGEPITVTDSLPAQLTYLSSEATCTAASPSLDGNTVTFVIAPPASLTCTIDISTRVNTDQALVVTNTATIEHGIVASQTVSKVVVLNDLKPPTPTPTPTPVPDDSYALFLPLVITTANHNAVPAASVRNVTFRSFQATYTTTSRFTTRR